MNCYEKTKGLKKALEAANAKIKALEEAAAGTKVLLECYRQDLDRMKILQAADQKEIAALGRQIREGREEFNKILKNNHYKKYS